MVDCIFCGTPVDPTDAKSTPPEHIIPECVDGTVFVYFVCKGCNHTLGSQVDAELNRKRHIWDARKRHVGLPPPHRPFRFRDAFLEADGKRVKMARRSDSHAVYPTKQADGSLLYGDCPLDEDPFYKYMDEERRRRGISDEQFQREHVDRYIAARQNRKYLGLPLYSDWLFTGPQVAFGEMTARAKSFMDTTTPHRFVAKACVEYARLVGIHTQIANLDKLIQHARVGGLEGRELDFREEVIGTDEPIYPCHTVSFTTDQFIIGLYDAYFVGVFIEWKGPPAVVQLLDDFPAGKLRKGEKRGEEWWIDKTRAISFPGMTRSGDL